MKKLLLFVAVLFCAAMQSQETKLLTSCCDACTSKVKSFECCSGDASCTACSNCKYFKHCAKEGGSCGVCTVYETPKPKAIAKARLPKGQGYKNYPKGKMLEVQSET